MRQEALALRSDRDSAPTNTRSFERAIIAGPRSNNRTGRGRVVGIDAARGFALIGMFAVHLMPSYAPEPDSPTWAWILFAGNASALFAILAGIALAFITGGPTPHTGERMRRARVQIATRALAVGLLGVLVNSSDRPVYNILTYLALTFVMAIPFVGLPRRALFIIGGLLMLVMPVARYLLHLVVGGAGYYPNPTFVDVFTDPLGVLATMSITGVYPALTWFGYICVGLGLGRVGLQRTGSRLALIVTGLLIYVLTTAVSFLVTMRFGGYELIRSGFPGATEEEVDEFVVFGPNGQLPTDGPGWLFTSAPHSNTTFALLTGAGFSLAAVGIFILLSRKWSLLLKPLIDAGSMSTTLYVGHLVFITYMPTEVPALALFAIQVLAAVLFAMIWRTVFKRGPLEVVIANTARTVGNVVVPRGK